MGRKLMMIVLQKISDRATYHVNVLIYPRKSFATRRWPLKENFIALYCPLAGLGIAAAASQYHNTFVRQNSF